MDSTTAGIMNITQSQLRKSSIMKNALSLRHSDILLQKEPNRDQRLRAMVNDILEAEAKSFDLAKGTSEIEQHQLSSPLQ